MVHRNDRSANFPHKNNPMHGRNRAAVTTIRPAVRRWSKNYLRAGNSTPCTVERHGESRAKKFAKL